MTKFPVRPETERLLIDRMLSLEIYEEDLEERFIRGGGPGGQKINKSATCVVLRHLPTGVEVRCQDERSQAMNRYRARVNLCDKVEEAVLGAKSKKQQEYEKIRRQKRRRSRKAKEKMLGEKRHRSQVKAARKSVGHDE
jgi:protein subunit release factor B